MRGEQEAEIGRLSTADLSVMFYKLRDTFYTEFFVRWKTSVASAVLVENIGPW